MIWCWGGMSVESKCVEEAEDSFADSGFVGLLIFASLVNGVFSLKYAKTYRQYSLSLELGIPRAIARLNQTLNSCSFCTVLSAVGYRL